RPIVRTNPPLDSFSLTCNVDPTMRETAVTSLSPKAQQELSSGQSPTANQVCRCVPSAGTARRRGSRCGSYENILHSQSAIQLVLYCPSSDESHRAKHPVSIASRSRREASSPAQSLPLPRAIRQ